MSRMSDDIFSKTRAGLQYLEFKIKEYEQEIKRLQQDLQTTIEELERERRPKQDER